MRDPISRKIRIYIDGELDGEGDDNTVVSLNADESRNLFIGADNNSTFGAQLYFKGIIDEVKIYNQALPTVEIEKHYAQKIDHYKDLTLGVLNY